PGSRDLSRTAPAIRDPFDHELASIPTRLNALGRQHMAKTPKLTSGDRETLIRSGFDSLVLEGAGGVATSPVWSKVAKAQAAANDRILVIVELSGGNDGLNTVIPYTVDAYYRARP